MRALLLAGTAMLALAGQAQAQVVPRPANPSDPHMRQQDYNPASRTLLTATVDRSLVLTFAPGEQIKRVVLGDEGMFSLPKPEEVNSTPLGNNLPLWPEKAGRTTLQIVTQRPGGEPDRVYQFAAVVRTLPIGCNAKGEMVKDGAETCPDDPEAIYGLTFAYPEDEAAKRAAEAAEARRAAQARAEARRARRQHEVAVARLQQDFTCTNGLYEARGDRTLAPDDACDDGQAIGLMFRGNRPVPAVFLVEVDHQGRETGERAIRPTTRGDWLIVPAWRERIRLRNGSAVLDIVNTAFNRSGSSPNTGTNSPDVFREVVHARQSR